MKVGRWKKVNLYRILHDLTIWAKRSLSDQQQQPSLSQQSGEKKQERKSLKTAHPPESIWVLDAGMICHHQSSGRRKETLSCDHLCDLVPASACIRPKLGCSPDCECVHVHVHGTKDGMLTRWSEVLGPGPRCRASRRGRVAGSLLPHCTNNFGGKREIGLLTRLVLPIVESD